MKKKKNKKDGYTKTESHDQSLLFHTRQLNIRASVDALCRDDASQI